MAQSVGVAYQWRRKCETVVCVLASSASWICYDVQNTLVDIAFITEGVFRRTSSLGRSSAGCVSQFIHCSMKLDNLSYVSCIYTFLEILQSSGVNRRFGMDGHHGKSSSLRPLHCHLLVSYLSPVGGSAMCGFSERFLQGKMEGESF